MTDTATRVFDMTGNGTVAVPRDEAVAVAAPVPSLLDAVRKAISAREPRRPITIKVPETPELSIRCSVDVQPTDLERWRSWSKADERLDADAADLAAHILVHTCRAVLFDGKEVRDDEGKPLTFNSPELQRQVGAMDPTAAVRAFIGNDWHLIAMGNVVLDKAGWTESVEQLDPTQRS